MAMACYNLVYLAAVLCLLVASSREAPATNPEPPYQPHFVSLLIIILLADGYFLAAGEVSSKQDCRREKRDAGLFPFPRVGKSYPFTWFFNQRLFPHNMIEAESGEHENGVTAKREQLIPFPRVGKSGPKRNGASGGGGLWFGPRLGRLSKRMLEQFPETYRQENNIPEKLFKSILKTPLNDLRDANGIDDYLDA